MMMSMIMTNSTISNSKGNWSNNIHIFDVEDHETVKPILLNQIDKMIDINQISPNEEGYLYDYNIKKPRTYEKLFMQTIYPYAVDVAEMYGLMIREKEYNNAIPWFQQYTQNTAFGWHQHNKHFAVVYYLELPEMSEATEFLNHDIPLKEGQIIFFPTFLVHRSPIIKSNTRKTIIATNLEFVVDREMIKNYGEESFKH